MQVGSRKECRTGVEKNAEENRKQIESTICLAMMQSFKVKQLSLSFILSVKETIEFGFCIEYCERKTKHEATCKKKKKSHLMTSRVVDSLQKKKDYYHNDQTRRSCQHIPSICSERM